MELPTLVAQVRNLSGDIVLSLTPAAGYRWLGLTGTAGRTHRRNETDGPYVEGTAEVTPAVVASLRRVETIKVTGDPSLTGDAYWRSVEDRLDDLEQATSAQFLWSITTGGYLWTYRTVGPADVDASRLEQDDFFVGQRVAVLSFTVQPNPTKVAP